MEHNQPSTRRYDSPVRRAQSAATRDRIVAAGCDVVRELGSWDWRKLTIRAVAERGGVHERTVYRHFPTEQDLRDAVIQRLEVDAGVTVEGLAVEDLREHVTQLFDYLASFASAPPPPVDPSLDAVDQRRKQVILTAIAGAAPTWGENDIKTAAAAIDVLWGVPAYRRLVDNWQLEPAEAARTVTWVIGLITDAVAAGRRPS